MQEAFSILVCNRKGGAGKTTLATNLAALFAAHRWKTVLLDCDAQQSAREWVERRGLIQPRVQVLDAHSNNGLLAPAIRLRVPHDAECLIYDSPAGTRGMDMGDLLRRARLVLVPVMPSPIDVAASAGFVEELCKTREVRYGGLKVAVLANRVRERQLSTRRLRDQLADWGVPLLGELRDTQLYVYAAGQGRAVHELKGRRAAGERATWQALYDAIFRLTGAGADPPSDGPIRVIKGLA